MTDQKDNKKKKGVWNAVFVVAVLVFIGALIALGVIAFSYFQGQSKYNRTADVAGFTPSDTPAAMEDLEENKIDWAALKAINPDTVAWIYIPNTKINYPVVRGEDNERYLTYDFDGDKGWLANYGAIFMDYRNRGDWTDQQYFIYGHHMNDGSMFADIAGMADQARFDECRQAYLLTPEGNFKLRTYALVHTDGSDEIVEVNFASSEDMATYIQDKMNRSVADPGKVPAAKDIPKSIALATCDNVGDGRYILYAYVEDAAGDGLPGQIGLVASEDGITISGTAS